jgi:serine/threonine protein kinase
LPDIILLLIFLCTQIMLARKRTAPCEGQAYVVKAFRKDELSAKGQVERTKTERDILYEMRHPFIVRLRYSFQSEERLYLVTDYYNDGTLFVQLRKARQFPEDRAKFYAAQLLSALDHLHQRSIIHRCLQLENVLLDQQGYVALTGFALSKQHTDETGRSTTFCGSSEYLPPEMLKGQKYDASVDWWSFGILM